MTVALTVRAWPAALVAAACLLAVSCSVREAAGAPPVPPCSLLSVEEVSAAIDAPASSGLEWESVGPVTALSCWFNSPKGFVQIWSQRAGAEADYQAAREQPRLQPQVDASGDGYQGFTWENPLNIQEAHLLKGGNYVTIIVGAGAVTGTAGELASIAVARLP